MLIRHVEVAGLAGLGPLSPLPLGRVVQVGGPPRALTALCDALALALGFFSPEEAVRAFARWGAAPQLPEPGRLHPEELRLERPDRVRPWLDPAADRTVRVSLELELDPPQFGRVRDAALRDPELSAALARGGARVQLSLGWLFTQDYRVVAPSVLSLRLGDLELRAGDERAPLLHGFLRGLAGRGLVREPLEVDEARYALAQRDADPERRARAARLSRALEGPPFGLGALEVVEPPGQPPWLAFGPELTPLRGLGPGALEAAGLADAVCLSGAEILVLRDPLAFAPDPGVRRAWLVEQAEGAGSTLEQVFLVGGAEAPDLVLVDPVPREAPAPLRAPRLGS